jgi:hypothetical protein
VKVIRPGPLGTTVVLNDSLAVRRASSSSRLAGSKTRSGDQSPRSAQILVCDFDDEDRLALVRLALALRWQKPSHRRASEHAEL